MVREVLTDHVPTPRRFIHPVPVEKNDPATAYENEISRAFGMERGDSQIARLDFILLGMGDDAHTASLFPGSSAQQESDRWIVANVGPSVAPPDRITMTYPLLNHGRHLAVLVTGAKKAAAVRKVDEQMGSGGRDTRRFPITGVDPVDGELTFYLDADAAGTYPVEDVKQDETECWSNT